MIQEFIDDIMRFIDRHQMARTKFGSEFMNDESFVRRLIEKRDCKISTIETVREKMAAFEQACENSGGTNA